jgi:HSP20 family protein
MDEKRTEVAPRDEQRLARGEPFFWTGSPFRMLERFAHEVDRVFDDFRLGHSWLRPRLRTESDLWAPDIEIYHRDHELVVRADLPGMKKENVKVEITDEAITIEGERRREQEEERGSVYRSERSYGSFCRTIPLPEGAITDQAKANFKDGVLEITMPAPPEQARRGRRLEIKESATTQK